MGISAAWTVVLILLMSCWSSVQRCAFVPYPSFEVIMAQKIFFFKNSSKKEFITFSVLTMSQVVYYYLLSQSTENNKSKQ